MTEQYCDTCSFWFKEPEPTDQDRAYWLKLGRSPELFSRVVGTCGQIGATDDARALAWISTNEGPGDVAFQTLPNFSCVQWQAKEATS